VDEAGALLGIAPDETTPDKLFTLECVNCLGACALGPVVLVNGEVHAHMSPGKLRGLVASLRAQEEGHADG
jgi:NADH:ubiquinone oxidoreductase subunit E